MQPSLLGPWADSLEKGKKNKRRTIEQVSLLRRPTPWSAQAETGWSLYLSVRLTSDPHEKLLKLSQEISFRLKAWITSRQVIFLYSGTWGGWTELLRGRLSRLGSLLYYLSMDACRDRGRLGRRHGIWQARVDLDWLLLGDSCSVAMWLG